jgi:N-acetylglutamate synthase-like GNAT family acetyltransferase
MEVQVELIDNTYSEAVINIILPIQQIEFNVPITLEDQPDLLDIDASYYENGGAFWGAKINGELVGTIAMIKYDKHSAAIRKMFVKKEYRGREFQIAKRLLDTLIAYSEVNGIHKLYLGTVNFLTAAIRFYERNGFEQVAVDALPPLFPRMRADDTFYCLTLNKG